MPRPTDDQVTVRAATAHDVPTLIEVMKAAIDELQRHVLDPAQVAASHAIMGLDSQLIDDGTYLVVEIDGQVAGCGGWSRRATMYGGDHSGGRDDTLVDPATEPARVRAMYTNPRYARRGVGRRILEGCQRAAAAEGFRRLELVATMAGLPLYESFGFAVDEELTDDAGGVAVPLARMSKSVPEGCDAVSCYRRLYDLPAARVAEAARDCLAAGVVFESSRLPVPLVGRDAVVGRILAIRDRLASAEVRRTTEIQRAGRSRRWCWRIDAPAEGPVEGTDVVTLTADGLIERLAVFDGTAPRPV